MSSRDWSKPYAVRLNEAGDTVERLSKTYHIEIPIIIRTLIGMAETYHLLEPNWQDLIIKDTIEQYQTKKDIDFNNEMKLIDLREAFKLKGRQFELAKQFLREYIKTLSEEEKKRFFDEKLHLNKVYRGEDPNALPFIDANSGKRYVSINYKRTEIFEWKGNQPVFPFNADRMVECATGYHTLGSWCSGCPKLADCPTIREERFNMRAGEMLK